MIFSQSNALLAAIFSRIDFKSCDKEVFFISLKLKKINTGKVLPFTEK
jgi:hypothetical protein